MSASFAQNAADIDYTDYGFGFTTIDIIVNTDAARKFLGVDSTVSSLTIRKSVAMLTLARAETIGLTLCERPAPQPVESLPSAIRYCRDNR